jgi:hypothetical protein
MSRSPTILSIISIAWLIFAVSNLASAQAPPVPIASTARATPAMTNDDVVKMTKMGFGNDVIEAKIRQVTSVDFRLEVEDLSKLKTAGVSQTVVAAMLQRATTKTETPRGAQFTPPGMPAMGYGATITTELGDVKLITKDLGDAKLQPSGGSMSMTNAFVTLLTYMNYAGLKSDARTHDRRPTLLIESGKSPNGRLFYVSADSDRRNGVRSVKVKAYANSLVPDSDNQVDCDVTSEREGEWKLTPKKDLRPGEYGLFVQPQFPLYDFGIDP